MIVTSFAWNPIKYVEEETDCQKERKKKRSVSASRHWYTPLYWFLIWNFTFFDLWPLFVYNLYRESLGEPYAWVTWQYHVNCRRFSDFAKLTFLTLVTPMWHLRGQRSCHKCGHNHWSKSLWQSFIKIGSFVYDLKSFEMLTEEEEEQEQVRKRNSTHLFKVKKKKRQDPA